MSDARLRAGGQDWAEIWRAMYDAERAQAEAVTPAQLVSPDDYWATQAPRFHAAAQRVPQPDSFMRFVLPHLRPGDRVADVGAGTGRYIPTLAAQARELLAIEPSPAMRAQLEATIAEHQLANVRLLAVPWPTAGIGPLDVVVCAHVLYSVAAVAPFIAALDAAAARACFLLLFLQHPLSALGPFWRRFHGEERRRLPTALEAFNLCHQLGIDASMQVIPATSMLHYSDAAEALVDLRWRLRFAPDPARDAALAQAIDELMDRDEDGTITPRGLPQVAAVVWWQKTNASRL